MNLQENIRKVLREEKLHATPQELVRNLPDELKKLLFSQWSAKQNPQWHPEGNTLKHILVVISRAYHHYPDDPNMIMAALFHDLGKMDTYKINPKTNQPTAYGHEDKSTDYVEQYRNWIESFEGTDVDEIKYLVKNHMKVKPSIWDQMKDKKKEPIKSHPAFDKLMGFTDKLDGGGTHLKESIKKVLREELQSKQLFECTIVGVRLDDGIVLAKNRDRGYKANVEVIHKLIDGVEVVYWRDVDTDWSEGLNEFGIGIVNASLTVTQDEKEGKDVLKHKKEGKTKKKFSADGGKIRRALKYNKIRDVVKSLISYVGDDKKDVGLKGETIVSDGKDIYVIELTSKHTPIIKKIKDDSKLVVRTNHGIYQKEAGYTRGEKRKSSVYRMELAKKHLQDVKTDQEVIDKLKEKYEKDPFLNPYRTKNMYNMSTTGQIMMNLEKKEITIRMDNEMGEFLGIKNDLPEGYTPKIKIKIESEKTHSNGKKLPT